MDIKFKHPKTGVLAHSRLGFSWTALFFMGLVPLFRGDWKWFLIVSVVSASTNTYLLFISNLWGSNFVSTFDVVSSIASGVIYSFPFAIVFALSYNKIHVKGLIAEGYVPNSESDLQAIQDAGILAKGNVSPDAK